MRAEDVVALLKASPFVPFRFVMTDGTTRDVVHPELVLVFRTYLELAFPSRSNEGIMDRFERCALIHIVRIEPLEREATRPAN